MQQDERLKTGDCDSQVRLNGEGTVEELFRGGPVARHDLFVCVWTGRHGLSLVVQGIDPLIELTEGAEREHEVHAANQSGIDGGRRSAIQLVEAALEGGTGENWAMNVETSEIFSFLVPTWPFASALVLRTNPFSLSS